MKMKSPFLLLLLLPVLVARSALAAAAVLDQSSLDFSSSSYVYNGVSMAQTFTPSITGILSDLDLYISQGQPSSQPVYVTITGTAGGIPAQSLFEESLYLTTQNWNWYDLNFAGANVRLTAGTLYAFTISTDTLGYANPAGSVEDHYPGGMSLVQNSTGGPWEPYSRAVDLDFQTYMIPVPEPGSGLLLLVAPSVILFLRPLLRQPLKTDRETGKAKG